MGDRIAGRKNAEADAIEAEKVNGLRRVVSVNWMEGLQSLHAHNRVQFEQRRCTSTTWMEPAVWRVQCSHQLCCR